MLKIASTTLKMIPVAQVKFRLETAPRRPQVRPAAIPLKQSKVSLKKAVFRQPFFFF